MDVKKFFTASLIDFSHREANFVVYVRGHTFADFAHKNPIPHRQVNRSANEDRARNTN
jgi:hypothetical protein